jgi:DNA phosphorothioation system restriction enzyme
MSSRAAQNWAQFWVHSDSNVNFKSLDIPFEVRTTHSDPIDVFFEPLLQCASSYDVAVGYFSSSWIRDAAAGIAALACNGGRSRWIISPNLTQADWDLLSSAPELPQHGGVAERAVLVDLTLLENTLEAAPLVALAWLIRDGILSFKIAIPRNKLSGMFHAKIGVFTDRDGNQVAFSGSYNLTGAAKTNWEVIDVYVGWDPAESKRVQARASEFERIWSHRDPNLLVFTPTDKLVAKFIEITEQHERPYKIKLPSTSNPQIPSRFLNKAGKLRQHQELAIAAWFKNNGRGIFQMATGSGKTVTALAVASKLTELVLAKKKKNVTLVTVPYKHLAEQWAEEAQAFGFDPLICYENAGTWTRELQRRLLNLQLGLEGHIFLITVNATFVGDMFQALLAEVNITFLFIADEMHNLGGSKIRTKLPQHAQFRLGLSATPKRHNDEIGTEIIYRYFGPVVAEYGIQEAIADGTLTRYFYHPVLIEFTEDEMQQYQELSHKISRLFAQGVNDLDEEGGALQKLLFERSRMLGSAENKIPTLKAMLSKRSDSCFNLIYCGDAIVDGERTVEKTLSMVGSELGMRARKFTSDETTLERKDILQKFGTGEIQVMAAIRCLDEGVDVPRTETAYILASTSDPRQYIQRRGRVLRRAEGKSFAHIYDFIVVPPAGMALTPTAFNVERRLVLRELHRVDEFAASSENVGDALMALRAIKLRLNLIDH